MNSIEKLPQPIWESSAFSTLDLDHETGLNLLPMWIPFCLVQGMLAIHKNYLQFAVENKTKIEKGNSVNLFSADSRCSKQKNNWIPNLK